MDRSSDSQVDKSVTAMALDFVYEKLPFSKPVEDPDQRQQRDKHQALIAESVADAAAMLPRYGPIAAGLSRATLLIKPNDSFFDNAKHFLANAAEGAALSRLTLVGLPESRIGKLSPTVATLSQGFGFGATKSVFRSDSWYQEDGSFSIKHGTYSAITSGLFASALTLPANYLTTKIATPIIGTSTYMGIRPALTISGASSGYATGFAIGGTNAWMEGKGGAEILSAANDSGLLSAALGASLMAASPLRFAALEKPGVERIGDVQKNAILQPIRIEPDHIHPHRIPKMSYKEEAAFDLTRPGVKPADLELRTQNHAIETQTVRVLDESKTIGSAPVLSDRFYLYKVTKPEQWELRRYDAGQKGMGPLYVKRQYADELDRIYIHDSHKEAGNAAPHHIDVQQAFLYTPDPSIINRIDHRPDINIWTLQHQKINRNPTMEIAATAHQKKAEISVNVKNQNTPLQGLADHEWAHPLETRTPYRRAQFDLAASVEKDGYYVSEYAKTNNAENWAEHASAFLGNSHSFLEFVHAAPVRAVILSRAINQSVQNAERLAPGSTDPGLLARIKYTEEEVMKKALGVLYKEMRTGMDIGKTASAAFLISDLAATPKQLNILENNAVESKWLAGVAYTALLNRIENQQYQFTGYNRIKVQDNQAQFGQFIKAHIDKGPYSRSYQFAIDGLVNQTRAINSIGLLGSDQNENKKTFANGLYQNFLK